MINVIRNKMIIAILVISTLSQVLLPNQREVKAQEVNPQEVGIYQLDVHEKTLYEKEMFTIQVPYGVYYTYDVVENQDSYQYDGDSCISIQSNEYSNTLLITANHSGTVTLTVCFYDFEYNYLGYDTCIITVLGKGIDIQSMVRAVGKTGQITLTGYQPSQILGWESSNTAVATVDQTGLVTAVAMGECEVSVNAIEQYGTTTTYTCHVSVSNPKLKKTSGNLAIGCETTLEITGVQPESVIQISSSQPSIAEVWDYNCSIYAIKKGKATITCIVDGVTLKYKVTVTDPKIEVGILPIIKGKKAQIKVKGTNSNSEISYQSLSSSVAKVNSKGYVTAKHIGSTSINVTVDGKMFIVPVSVSTKKVINTLKYAIKAIGKPYSQEKRMSKGFYDCSSLAWRSYHSAGVDIGNHYWAPTAADMAKTLVKEKKAVAYKALPASKLKPGDLLFFTKTDGTDNGRYKNIYHVAIFFGTYGDDPDCGLLLEARLDGIGIFTYYPSDRKVAVIARPTK